MPVIEPDLRVLVVRRRVARLSGELARVLDPVLVAGGEHAPAARSVITLLPLKEKACEVTLRPRGLVAVRRTERLGRVLDEDDATFGAESAEPRL